MKIHSSTLATDLWLIPTGFDGHTLDGPVYTCEECRLLAALDLSAAELKAVHLVKVLFHGDLLLAEDPRSLRRRCEILLKKYREAERRLGDSAKGTSPEGDHLSELLRLSSHLSLLLNRLDLVEGAGPDPSRANTTKDGENPG